MASDFIVDLREEFNVNLPWERPKTTSTPTLAKLPRHTSSKVKPTNYLSHHLRKVG